MPRNVDNHVRRLLRSAAAVVVFFAALVLPEYAAADRVKDLTRVQGIRDNQLLGYSLVVGLDGTGDQTTQTPFTVQSLVSMLKRLGVRIPEGTNLQLKNVAAVMVTAQLPAFAQSGQAIDVTVSSLGNAKSLRGGTLLMTPLKGADGQVYAMAQGNVVVGGIGAGAAGSSVTINHLSVGRIPRGGTVERAVRSRIGDADAIYLELERADFSNARNIVDAINMYAGPGTATASDPRRVRVLAPADANQRVAFLAEIENIEVMTSRAGAKVVVNSRTGSVVMNQTVMIDPCAVAHGTLAVVISTEPVISQPGAFSRRGDTVVTERSQVEIRQEEQRLVMLPQSVSLADVVQALNSIGATPQDLTAILQAMESAGVLHAELEII